MYCVNDQKNVREDIKLDHLHELQQQVDLISCVIGRQLDLLLDHLVVQAQPLPPAPRAQCTVAGHKYKTQRQKGQKSKVGDYSYSTTAHLMEVICISRIQTEGQTATR